MNDYETSYDSSCKSMKLFNYMYTPVYFSFIKMATQY